MALSIDPVTGKVLVSDEVRKTDTDSIVSPANSGFNIDGDFVVPNAPDNKSDISTNDNPSYIDETESHKSESHNSEVSNTEKVSGDSIESSGTVSNKTEVLPEVKSEVKSEIVIARFREAKHRAIHRVLLNGMDSQQAEKALSEIKRILTEGY